MLPLTCVTFSCRRTLHMHMACATHACTRHMAYTPLCCRLVKPDEVYNLGAQSHVQVSFELPQYTAEASGVVSQLLWHAIAHLEKVKPSMALIQSGNSQLAAELGQ